MQRLLSKMVPFLLAGIAIVFLALSLTFLAYLFLIGAAVGLILFLFTMIRDKFFPHKKVVSRKQKPGITIDSDDWTKLP